MIPMSCLIIWKQGFSDFEDCLQVQCAKEVKADYIVTRNVNDYICSDVKVLTSKEFVREKGK